MMNRYGYHNDDRCRCGHRADNHAGFTLEGPCCLCDCAATILPIPTTVAWWEGERMQKFVVVRLPDRGKE
jgi:hypothetical protein